MDEWHLSHPADAVVVALAARQHAHVSTAQLLAAGLTHRAIARRVERGWLTAVHRGVYRVGPLEAPLGRVMAAVLACGPDAVASHGTAAALHGFSEEGGTVQVTVDARRRAREGVRIHRSPLPADEVTCVEGIRVTTPARTIRDGAAGWSARELRRAIEEALIQRKLDHTALTDAVHQARGQRGAAALRAAVADVIGSGERVTRSHAERKLLDLIDRAGLPRPQTNVRIGRHEVDAFWPRERLVVEVDGYAFHGGRAAFERDRARDGDLAARGIRVVRVTWRQMTRQAEAVAARLAGALATG